MSIGWILCGNRDTGSSRIGGFNIHADLIQMGHRSSILSFNRQFSLSSSLSSQEFEELLSSKKITTVVFQKVCSRKILDFVQICKDKNIRTVYACGDWHETPMWRLADAVVVCSSFTKQTVEQKYQRGQVFYIEDGLEIPLDQSKEHVEKDQIKFGWFGNRGHLPYANAIFDSLDIEVYTISNDSSADMQMGPSTGVEWSPIRLRNELIQNIDVLTLPIDDTNQDKAYAKSANRIAIAMALGIPVIATPIPSYELAIENGINGFLASNLVEWKEALDKCGSSSLRQSIAARSIPSARSRFSRETIVREWIKVLKK